MPPEPEQADELGRLYDRLGPSLYRYALMILADRGATARIAPTTMATRWVPAPSSTTPGADLNRA